MHRAATALRAKTRIPLTEDDFLKSVQRTCDALTEEGEWIAHLDLVEHGASLVPTVQVRAMIHFQHVALFNGYHCRSRMVCV